MVDVSIVVPIYNREHFVRQCLLPLTRQHYARFEIIVVDDGSTDHTAEIVRDVASEWAGTLRLIQQPNCGPASARNAGISASTSHVVAFIDSDCVAGETWLQSLIDTMTEAKCAGVGGPIVGADVSTWIGRYVHERHLFRQRVRNGNVDYLLTSNAAFRREALVAIGGFRTERQAWSEDADLSFRLRNAGFTLAVTDDGQVIHYGTPDSLPTFARTLYRYGRGNAILSTTWHNGRSAAYEIARRIGALILSPLLTISYINHVGFAWAISFWPLLIVEHSAFLIGYLRGILARISRK